MHRRILLTGCNGQLGRVLASSLAPLGELHAVDIAQCDFVDLEALRRLVKEVQPALIVNAAAYTLVDKAETEPLIAEAVNSTALAVLGAEARKLGAWVIHFSTDYVFDGEAPRAYREEDRASPKNVYGRTKRAGELSLQASGVDSLIIRTSWLMGAHGSNFLKAILSKARQHSEFQVVEDQWGAPTSVNLIAGVTRKLIDKVELGSRSQFPFGIYHVTAGGETSRHEYAQFIVSKALALGAQLQLQPENILPVLTSDYPLSAARPLNSRLSTRKFRKTFGFELPSWQVDVQSVLAELKGAGWDT